MKNICAVRILLFVPVLKKTCKVNEKTRFPQYAPCQYLNLLAKKKGASIRAPNSIHIKKLATKIYEIALAKKADN